jgi:hypothetical protein
MTQNGKAGRILHRAAADARQIVAWRWAGYSVTRRKCESYGMGQYRWAWAMALLRVAGVAPYPGDTDNFLVEDLDDATARIDQAVRMTEASRRFVAAARAHVSAAQGLGRLRGGLSGRLSKWLQNTTILQPSRGGNAVGKGLGRGGCAGWLYG